MLQDVITESENKKTPLEENNEKTNNSRMSEIVTTAAFSALVGYVYAAIPNDPSLNKQYAVDNMELINAWDIATGSDQVVVAVIDSGIDSTHEDLKNNIWTNQFQITDKPRYFYGACLF